MTSHLRIIGEFKTLSPLSHISEAISTVSYLVEEPVLQPDGSIENVFCYNGNAWRGQLRDLAAKFMLDTLGRKASLDTFHLLFSGGKIGGEQTVDIGRAREIRNLIPMVALFGGGIGNQILPGKMRVGNSYPVCKEAAAILPAGYAPKASYSELTFEKSFTRMDDGKDPDLSEMGEGFEVDGKPKKKADGEASTQMRMTSELLCAGVTLVHEIDLIGVSDIEIGVLLTALETFAMSPHIGGQSNRGHGKVSYTARVVIDMKTGNKSNMAFISGDDVIKISGEFCGAKEAYLGHLKAVSESGELDKFLVKKTR